MKFSSDCIVTGFEERVSKTSGRNYRIVTFIPVGQSDTVKTLFSGGNIPEDFKYYSPVTLHFTMSFRDGRPYDLKCVGM